MRLLFAFGTRPEAIKTCPVIKEFQKRGTARIIIAVTGQHRELCRAAVREFGIVPDFDLDIMREGQTLFELTARVLDGMRGIIENTSPTLLFVHGDTASAYASALAAFYLGVPVAHIEAGLRTYKKNSPFPEEFYRRSIALISELNFAPTYTARDNLINEGAGGVFVTGNTVVDALRYTVSDSYRDQYTALAERGRILLVTCHRRENGGERRRSIFRAAAAIARRYEGRLSVILPAHPSPDVRAAAEKELNGSSVLVTEPLSVVAFHNLLSRSFAVLTDSGGVQEEAAALGIPALIVREVTERSEGIISGASMLAGTEEERIIKAFSSLFDEGRLYSQMKNAANPYGDGRASQRIADITEELYG